MALLTCAALGCMFDEPLKHDLGIVPEQLDDGWEIASPESVGLSSEALAHIHRTLLREDRFVGSLGLLVIKDGKLVWETYLRTPRDRDRYHHVQSVTKSVVSVVFGQARDRGYFDSLEQSLGDLFPERMRGLDPKKSVITLEHLLTMRSGIEFDNLHFNIEMYTFDRADRLRYILEKPLYAEPGLEFRYRNADPQILSYAVQRVTGASVRALAESWLFQPLSIRDFYWQDGPDGATIAGNGLHLRTRDLAKIGQLVLDGGVWRSQRVISEDWIDRMASVHVDCRSTSSTKPELPCSLPNSDLEFPYGYYWYVMPDHISGVGTGGQFLFIDFAERLVLVHVALPNTVSMHGSTLSDFLALVRELI